MCSFISQILKMHIQLQNVINNGIPVPSTFKDMIKGIYENGFPYLLIIPSYVAMTFAIIFPVIVTLMIAFTNYDFQHLPPNKLLDWVGLTNFTNIWSLSTFRSAFGAVLSWTIIWALAASTFADCHWYLYS